MATIKLTNNVQIDPTSINIGIDTNNVLASTPTLPWTPTQNCWALIVSSSYQNYLIVDNIDKPIAYASLNSNLNSGLLAFIKKGQTISRQGTAGTTAEILYAYGTK